MNQKLPVLGSLFLLLRELSPTLLAVFHRLVGGELFRLVIVTRPFGVAEIIHALFHGRIRHGHGACHGLG